MNMKKAKKSSNSLSLPYDVVLNCLARTSRLQRPTLSLVSKSIRSLIASSELEATRSRMGIREDCLYVCLDLDKNNTNPQWFTLAPTPKQQKLLPIPNSYPYQHQESLTIVSMGSEMYLIGGLVNEKRSTRVLVLDCRTHQWRSLPDMVVPRNRPAAEVIDCKIYVIGGCGDEHDNIEDWGEVYDPKTQTWEPLSPTTLDHLITQKSVVPGNLVMGGKVYNKHGLERGYKKKHICLVEIETNMWCEIKISGKNLVWRDASVHSEWWRVEGLEKLIPTYLVSVANSGGRRVTVWWKTVECSRRGGNKYPCLSYNKITKTDIWCAEISFQRQGVRELEGYVEWSKPVFTINGCDCDSDFFLHSAIVNH